VGDYHVSGGCVVETAPPSWGEKTDFCRNHFHMVTHVMREEGEGNRGPTLRKSCCCGPLMVDRSQHVKKAACHGRTVRDREPPELEIGPVKDSNAKWEEAAVSGRSQIREVWKLP